MFLSKNMKKETSVILKSWTVFEFASYVQLQICGVSYGED